MIVYVDVLVVLNIFVNYFLLLGTKGFLKTNIKRYRLFLGAFMGGFYSLVIFLPDLPDVVTLLMNMLASALIVFVTFFPKTIKLFLKYFAAFFAVNFIFAGLMLAVWVAFKPQSMVYNNSVVYFDIDVKVLVISTVVCYFALSGISFFTKKIAPENKIYDVTLYNKGRTVMTKALLDTGNSLSDGFSSTPVVIASKDVVRRLIDYSLNDFFDGNNAINFTSASDNVRLIPFNTVGSGGVLRAVKIESIVINKEHIQVNNILLAESKTAFSNDEYSVLLNNDFLNGRSVNNVKNDKILIFKD